MTVPTAIVWLGAAASCRALKRLHDERSAEQHERDRPEAQNLACLDQLQPVEDEHRAEQDEADAEGQIRGHSQARFIDCHACVLQWANPTCRPRAAGAGFR